MALQETLILAASPPHARLRFPEGAKAIQSGLKPVKLYEQESEYRAHRAKGGKGVQR